jgi:hypothetical protein
VIEISAERLNLIKRNVFSLALQIQEIIKTTEIDVILSWSTGKCRTDRKPPRGGIEGQVLLSQTSKARADKMHDADSRRSRDASVSGYALGGRAGSRDGGGQHGRCSKDEQ